MAREAQFQYFDEFSDYLLENGVPRGSSKYKTGMNTASRRLERSLGPEDLSTQRDADRLIAELVDVAKGDPTFDFKWDSKQAMDQRSVFRKYANMIESNYRGLFRQEGSISISPTRFRAAFGRFQAIHTKECGWPVESFSNRDSFAFQWEGYKHAIPVRAGAVLKAHRWTRNEIGKGDILKRVIQAIELPGNNLLQWEGRHGPSSRAHSKLFELQTQPGSRQEIEELFYNLFKGRVANEETFEGIVRLCGKKYELLGYLFFIADPGRFLPLRTQSFDKALAELGVDLKTGKSCGWKNYQMFISAIREVRTRLHAEGIVDASLLDAHSFCWILARNEPEKSTKTKINPAIFQTFDGKLATSTPTVIFSPKDDAEIRNMREKADKCHASGQIAEEISLQAERIRLLDCGLANLAAKVVSVADRPGLGYDIKSFEADGTERYIEVKNVSNGRRFFLSSGEWLNSRERGNYWFYLVSGAGTSQPKITMMKSDLLQESHLQPTNYLVSYE